MERRHVISFYIQYVQSAPHSNQAGRDAEMEEVNIILS